MTTTKTPPKLFSFFFFNDTATTEIYTLSLHDALPIGAERILRSCEPAGQHVDDDSAPRRASHHPVAAVAAVDEQSFHRQGTEDRVAVGRHVVLARLDHPVGPSTVPHPLPIGSDAGHGLRTFRLEEREREGVIDGKVLGGR